MTIQRARERLRLLGEYSEERRRKRTWTRRATALAATSAMLVGVGYYTGLGWLYIIEAVLLSLLVVAFLLARWELRGVHAHRTVTPYSFEGDTVFVRLVVENHSRRRKLLLELRDRFPAAPPDSVEAIRLIEMLDAGGRAARSYQAQACRRGRYTFGPVEVRSGGPFGILFATKRVAQPTSLLVYPTVEPLPHSFLDHATIQSQQTLSRALVGDDQQFRSIREFRSGDPRRWIHWRSSARLGRLVVKQFEMQRQPRLILVLDSEVGHTLGHGRETTFEYVVKAASSLAYQAFEEGQTVELIWASRDGIIHERPKDRWEALAHLAEVEPHSLMPFPRLLTHLEAETLFDALVVALLPLPQEKDTIALDALRTRASNVIAILADRESFDGSHPPARTLAGQLISHGVDCYILTCGESISTSLSRAV